MLWKIFKLLISIFLCVNLLINNSFNNFLYPKNILLFLNKNIGGRNHKDVVSIPSIFETRDKNAAKKIMLANIESIAQLYREKKINDQTIADFFAFAKIYADKKRTPKIYMLFVTGLTFRINYPDKGEIQNIEVLYDSGQYKKPVKITTDSGMYVFKPLFDTKFLEQTRYLVALNNHLTKKGIPLPKLIPKTGQLLYDENSYIVDTQGTYYILMEYVDKGIFLKAMDITSVHYKKIGRLAAQIQNAVMDFNPRWHRRWKSKYEIIVNGDMEKIRVEKEKFFETLEQEIQGQYREYYDLIEAQYSIFKRSYNPAEWARSHIHNDLYYANLKFDETGQIIEVLDLGISQEDFRISEFGNIMMGGISSFKDFRFQYFYRKLIDTLTAYQSTLTVPLNESEIRGIIEIIRARFLEDCFACFLQNPEWIVNHEFSSPEKRKEFLIILHSFQQFADDFSTEEQISAFVKEMSFTDIDLELISLGLSKDDPSFNEIAMDVFALYKKNDGSIRNPQDKKRFLQNIVYAVVIKYKQKLAPKIIKNLLPKILLRFMPSVNPSFSEKVLSYMERFSETIIHDYGIGVANVNVNSDNEYLEILMYCAIAPLLENAEDKKKFVIDILKNRGFKDFLLDREGNEFIDSEIKEKVMKLFFGSGKEQKYKLTSNSLFAALEITIERGKRLKNVLEDILVRGRRFPHAGELSLTYDESITEVFYEKEVEKPLLDLGFKQETYAFSRAKRIVMQGLKKEAKFPFDLKKSDIHEFVLLKLREVGFLKSDRGTEIINFENINQTPEFRDMDEFFHDMRSSEQFNSDEPGNFLEKMKTFLGSETGTEIARGQEAYTGPADLDGKTIIFPVRNFEQGGGVVTYIEAQMAYLLARNNVTIHLMCAAKDVGEITKMKFGKGTIVFHPIPSVDYAINMGLEIDKIETETGVDLILTHEYTLESYAAMYYANKKRFPSLDICHLGQCSIRHRQYHSIFWQSRVFYLAFMLGVVSDAALKYSEFLSPDKRRVNFGPMLNLGVFGNELNILDEIKISELKRTLKLGERGNPNVFLLPSRIAVNKGPLMMLQACNRVFKTKGRNDFLIILTCSAPDERCLNGVMQYIRDNGLQDNVLFLGAKDGDIKLLNPLDFADLLKKGGGLDAISQEDLKYFYAVSTVVALPTLVESFPLVPLEAQLMNKSVIVGLTDGTPETFIAEESHLGEGTGFGMKIEDLRDAFDGFVSRDEIVSRLAAILEKMFPDDPTKAEQMKKYRETMGKKGRDFVISQFSPSSMIAHLETAFAELLFPSKIQTALSEICGVSIEKKDLEQLILFIKNLKIETGFRDEFNRKNIEKILCAV